VGLNTERAEIIETVLASAEDCHYQTQASWQHCVMWMVFMSFDAVAQDTEAESVEQSGEICLHERFHVETPGLVFSAPPQMWSQRNADEQRGELEAAEWKQPFSPPALSKGITSDAADSGSAAGFFTQSVNAFDESTALGRLPDDRIEQTSMYVEQKTKWNETVSHVTNTCDVL
jgi:hypothetical protein